MRGENKVTYKRSKLVWRVHNHDTTQDVLAIVSQEMYLMCEAQNFLHSDNLIMPFGFVDRPETTATVHREGMSTIKQLDILKEKYEQECLQQTNMI